MLEKNIIHTWGEQGKVWLKQLPSVIEVISKKWSLTHIKPVSNMSYNYVGLATQKNNAKVVLKVSCDKQLILSEYKALKYFAKSGAIKVLDIDKNNSALLLQQAIPGFLLKDYSIMNIEDTINIYARVVNTLAALPIPQEKYPHVVKWCKTIERIDTQRIDLHLIRKAKELNEYLLKSMEREYLCHGDLHLQNIIQHEEKWLVIDPKGIIGEKAFEAAAFDIISKHERENLTSLSAKILDRTALLAKTLGLDFNRLLSWIFLRAIISAQWFIEDSGDPSEMLFIAHHIYPLLDIKAFDPFSSASKN